MGEEPIGNGQSCIVRYRIDIPVAIETIDDLPQFFEILGGAGENAVPGDIPHIQFGVGALELRGVYRSPLQSGEEGSVVQFWHSYRSL
jgi:hypothetical protein